MDRNRALIVISLLILLKCLGGCVKTGNVKEEVDFQSVPEGVNPVEMQVWTPPSEEELALRRMRQEELDRLTADIESLVMKFNDLDLNSRNLGVAAQTFPPKLQEMDQKISGQVAELEKSGKKRQEEVAAVKASFDKTGSDLQAVIAEEERLRFRPDDYQSAFVLFRQAKYKQAAAQFQKVFQSRYPGHLQDNILFGLGASLYKLDRLKPAAKYLEKLVGNNRKSDKWYEASLLLGLLYNKDSRRSRALYILQNALKENPPANIRPLLERLFRHTEEGDGLVPG